MKKIIILIFSVILLSGCFKNDEKKLAAMRENGQKYYQTYGSSYEIDEYTVSLGDIRKAASELKQDYDLTELEKCKDTSSIIFKIKNKRIDDSIIKLDC